jgi:hypothetical protein
MTTDIDSVLERFTPRATPPSLPVGRSLLGLLLLAAAPIGPRDEISVSPHIRCERTEGTVVVGRREERVAEADILRALARVHDTILNQAVELDAGARALLYDHLWDLYS